MKSIINQIQQLRANPIPQELIDNFNILVNEEKNEIFEYIFSLRNNLTFEFRINFFLNPLVKFNLTPSNLEKILKFTFYSEFQSKIIVNNIINNRIPLEKKDIISILSDSKLNSYLTEQIYEWARKTHSVLDLIDIFDKHSDNDKKYGFLYKDIFESTQDAEKIYLPILLKKGIKPSHIITNTYIFSDNKDSLNMIKTKLFKEVNEHQLIAIGLALLNHADLKKIQYFDTKYPILKFISNESNFLSPILDKGIHNKLLRYLGSNIQEDTFDYLLKLNLNPRLTNNMIHIALTAHHKPYFPTLIKNIEHVEPSFFIYFMFMNTVQNKKYQTAHSNYFMDMCSMIKNKEQVKAIIDCLDNFTYNNKNLVVHNLCSDYIIYHEKLKHPFFNDFKKILLKNLLESELENKSNHTFKKKI